MPTKQSQKINKSLQLYGVWISFFLTDCPEDAEKYFTDRFHLILQLLLGSLHLVVPLPEVEICRILLHSVEF